jgi:hypothetical protein
MGEHSREEVSTLIPWADPLTELLPVDGRRSGSPQQLENCMAFIGRRAKPYG